MFVVTLVSLYLLAVITMHPFFEWLINKLLGIVKTLAFVTHMLTINLHYSPQMQAFFSILFTVLTFDALPTDDWFEYIFKLSQYTDLPRSE